MQVSMILNEIDLTAITSMLEKCKPLMLSKKPIILSTSETTDKISLHTSSREWVRGKQRGFSPAARLPSPTERGVSPICTVLLTLVRSSGCAATSG